MWELNSAVARDFLGRGCLPLGLSTGDVIDPSMSAVRAAGRRQTLGRGYVVMLRRDARSDPSDACLSKGSSAGRTPIPWRNRYQFANNYRWRTDILRTTGKIGLTKISFSKRELGRTTGPWRLALAPDRAARPWKRWSRLLWQAPPCRPLFQRLGLAHRNRWQNNPSES